MATAFGCRHDSLGPEASGQEADRETGLVMSPTKSHTLVGERPVSQDIVKTLAVASCGLPPWING